MSDNPSSSPQPHCASYAPDAYPEAPNAPHSPTVDGSSTIKTSESDDLIPPTHACRTLVLCFDGTGDQFDADNSNIVQFFSMLQKDDPREQMVYYQAGIGTYTIPQMVTPFYAKLSKTIDLMVGNHLDAHVMSGYEFLMQNYQAGDKICLFGFSRGAYTARALAGMLHKVGLLPPSNYQQVPFAYRMYTRDDHDGWKQSTVFKKAYSIDVDVEFVGVWDTVNSVGIIPRRLPFTKANNQIRFFRHALSLDEHRIRFMPSFYHRSTQADNELGVQKGEMPRSVKKSRTGHNRYDQPQHDTSDWNGHHHELSPQDSECFCTQPITQTNVDEVWFAGCHCDVGGGSVKNGARNSLARIPLRWMIREIFKAGVGILFYRSMFQQIGMDPSSLHSPFDPRPPIIFNSPIKAGYVTPYQGNDEAIQCNPNGNFVNEELEDLYDARSEIHDELTDTPYWWILEVLPQMMYYQREEDHQLAKEIKVNMGKGRRVPKREPPKVHRTVQIRMAADDLPEGKYRPKAEMTAAPVWVD
ncbi:hypothetical protein PISMIDRAFT_441682 [Pisolithus microcarpus 441]|uniref:Unplaced genomic scaffold scaffold_4, whole genome shotgun sequence n=1 Tax=Pisolithus microcarpus 441 TaxID=765257 RepID=A0A0C9ZUV2_9AGAM|nr:hypothetical protein BKA83DRAFT_441682 [Pisolithus microcarpus]KIK29794.1 hypothetical protein PISMIDRAFT_441682 [Pisolithus microcarpus 441]